MIFAAPHGLLLWRSSKREDADDGKTGARHLDVARPLNARVGRRLSTVVVDLARHPARHLLRAKDLIDARYRDPLDVPMLARAAHMSPAHFSREFRRTFGETPHQYLLTRRLERAAALLRNTDHAIIDVCLAVGLRSVGSFTTSFTRTYGLSPAAYRAAHPPAVARARIPTCVQLAWARPRSSSQSSRFREDTGARRD